MFRNIVIGAAAVWALGGGAALADRLSERWQTPRTYYIELSHRACDGDEMALGILTRDAWDDANPVAMSNLAWLIRPDTPCIGVFHDRREWLTLQKESAEMGYPVSMFNWGEILLTGSFGPEDFLSGMLYLEEASAQGYAGAAELLAKIYAQGRHGVEPDQSAAYMFFERAQSLGLDEGRLTRLIDLIRNAETGMRPKLD